MDAPEALAEAASDQHECAVLEDGKAALLKRHELRRAVIDSDAVRNLQQRQEEQKQEQE